MSAAHRSVADPRLSGIRRIALRFSIIFQNVCTAPNKPTDSVEPSTTYTAYMPHFHPVAMTLGIGSGSPLFSLSFLLIMLLALYQQIMAGWEARPPAPDRWGGLCRPAYKMPDISASGARGQNEEAQMKKENKLIL